MTQVLRRRSGRCGFFNRATCSSVRHRGTCRRGRAEGAVPGRAFALLCMLALFIAAPLAAQRRAVLEITLPSGPAVGATVAATNLFAEADMRDLVRSGFPASLHFRLELWRTGGLFDDLEGRLEWDVIVQYDPSAQRYRVVRRQGGKIDDLGLRLLATRCWSYRR